MIIIVTAQDMWDEFVFYRKSGLTDLAFQHIRREETPYKWRTIVASIAYSKYNPKIGDIIRFIKSPVEFIWNEKDYNRFSTV